MPHMFCDGNGPNCGTFNGNVTEAAACVAICDTDGPAGRTGQLVTGSCATGIHIPHTNTCPACDTPPPATPFDPALPPLAVTVTLREPEL